MNMNIEHKYTHWPGAVKR